MQPLKSMDAALSNENERREKDKKWFDRGQDSKGNPYHYDWWRRNLNFEIVKGKIVPKHSQSVPLHERLRNRLTELGFKPYKAGAPNPPNVCMDFVIGGNHERMTEMAFGEQTVNVDSSDEKNSQLTRCSEIERWAMDTYQWAAKKYGEENIVGFNVHLDETTPHIHMQVIPVGKVQKRGRVKAGEERGTKLAVSYAAVVGKEPEDLSRYLDAMHTDYHLQVGHKYGLERGDFFADLTPEEQAERRHRTKAEYNAYMKEKKEREKTKIKNAAMKEENTALKEQNKQIEKKVKGLTTMVRNLEEQKDNLEVQIAALEEEYTENNEQKKQKIAELSEKVADLQSKIADKTEKLKTAEQQLDGLTGKLTSEESKFKNLALRNMDLENEIKTISADAAKDIEWRKDKIKEADMAIQEKRAEVAKMDKNGEIQRAQYHANQRENVLYRLWPEAREAVKAVFDLGNSPTATDFTPQQALVVEHALVTSGTTRTKAAEELMSLARRDFEARGTFSGTVKETGKVLMSIANGTHQRLTALLKQQSKDTGGGPSYITDLTDWAGNQIQW